MVGVDSTAPRRRWRPWHFILIGLLAVVALGVAIVTLVFSLTGPVVAAADTFMGALRDGDYARAFSQSAPALQRQLGGAQGYGNGIGRYRPATWSWSQRSIRNGVGRVSGSVTYQDGASGSVRLTLHQLDDGWRVEGYSFNGQ